MRLIDFTASKISCVQERLFTNWNVRRLTAVVSFIFSSYAAFGQGPVLSNIEAAALSFDEGQAATQVTNTITASDPDSPLLASATIQITSNFSATEDVLVFANAFSITGSYDAASGTLTLSGPASPSDFTNALQTITYQNINNNNPSNLARTISFSVNDGSSNSLVVTRTVQVNPLNDAPVGQPDSFVMYEDTDLDCGCLLINDVDPDGDPLVALHADPPAHGTVTDLGGFFIYTPNPDYFGPDSFTYYANDGTGNSAPILVTITVLPVNDAPVAVDDAALTDEDSPVVIPVLANDSDVDDILDVSMIEVVSAPSNGTVAINTATGKVTYTPNLNYNGNDSFTYNLKDAAGALSNIVTVNIVVDPVNDAPVATADNVTTPEDTPILITVLTNDTDVENGLDPASVVIVTTPANGGAVVQPTGAILYTPTSNFNGGDSFTYTVKDAEGATSAPATVTVAVTPVNDVPVANADIATTLEDTPVLVAVLVNDVDVENTLDITSVVVASTPANGLAVVESATGKILYTPNNNFVGGDSFTYTVKDAEGSISAAATVTITVTPVNDAPVANNENAVTPEETAVSIAVLTNDLDIDGGLDANSVALATVPAHGIAVVQPSGEILYTPALNYNGSDSFTYTVNDGDGATSAPATVTITVTPVNDAPIANDDVASTSEDVAVSISVLANDTDVENGLDPSTLVILTGPTNGSAMVQAGTGKILYTPASNFTGNDSFTYAVKDNGGASTNAATVSVTVLPVNDAPTANPDVATTAEETAVSIDVLVNDVDTDNALDAGSLTIVTSPAYGSAVVEGSTGAILYTPKKDYTGTDSFTYSVQDVSGATSAPATVTVTVTPVNDPPVAVNDATSTDKNASVGIHILLNDYDVDNTVQASSVVITSDPAHGTLTFNPATGLANFTPDTDYTGEDHFTYTIQDAGGLVSSPATVTITVDESINSAPVAVDDGPISNSYLDPVVIDVMANDYDLDNSHDELTLVSVTNPSQGTVHITNGMIVYQPGGLVSGTVTFTYTIQDPSGLTAEAVVTIVNVFLPLAVSEGFSPNNDNSNETWFIQGIEYYPNNSVKVFDRWGFLVYQKQHYENTTSPWDGRGNMAQVSGKLLDQGTYYYILEPGDELRTMTGYVVIVR